MKKIYSTVMMLAMMVAALGMTACGDDDNDEGSAHKTLIIDGESYYCGHSAPGRYLCTVSQSKSGMHLTVAAIEDIHPIVPKGKELSFRISPTKVSELSVGQVFDYAEIGRIHFGGLGAMPSTEILWYGIDGEMVIKDIKETELTIQFKNFTIKHKKTDTEHTIEGTATLCNSMCYSDGEPMPFSETEP